MALQSSISEYGFMKSKVTNNVSNRAHSTIISDISGVILTKFSI